MPTEGEIITNLQFDFQFASKTYQIKRANLRQVMEWQRKMLEMGKKETNGVPDAAIIAPALYIILHAVDSTITEDYILDNCPGDINVTDTLLTLGFASQQKVVKLSPRNPLANQQSGEVSSAS